MKPFYKVILFVFLISLAAKDVYAGVAINEVMYNPEGDDNNKEFVELYLSSFINLTGYVIGDKSSNDTLACLYRCEHAENLSYALVVEDDFNFSFYKLNVSEINASIYGAGKSIGNGLNNNGDSIFLYDREKRLVASFTYNSSMGANGDGKSLQLSKNGWIEFFPSVGRRNFYPSLHVEVFSMELGSASVNNKAEVRARVVNRGYKSGEGMVKLFVNGTKVGSKLVNFSALGEDEVEFNAWVPEKEGIYTLCVQAENTLCREVHVSPLKNESVRVDLAKNVDGVTIFTVPSNASCEINYTIHAGNVTLERGTIKKNAFENVSIKLGFGSFRVRASMDVLNFRDTSSDDNVIEKDVTILPGNNSRYRIRVWTDRESYGLNESLFWIAQVFLPMGKESVNGRLSLNLGRKGTSGFNYFTDIYDADVRLNKSVTIFSGKFRLPEDYVEGIYKLRAKFSYSDDYIDSYNDGMFWLEGLADMGDMNFSVLKSIPGEASFGDFLPVNLVLNSNNDNGEVEIKAGINKNLDKGSASYPYVSLPLKIKLERGKTYFISLPLLIDPNCNGRYEDGRYRAVVYIDSRPFEVGAVRIRGRNDNLCTSPRSASTKSRAYDEGGIDIELLNFTETLARNEVFYTPILLKNNLGRDVDVEVYSYIHRGKNLATGGWASNKVNLRLRRNEVKKIVLMNRVREEVEPGEYTFKVRVRHGEKTYDFTRSVRISREVAEALDEGVDEKQEPELKIWADKKLRINLTKCSGCRMIIVGPGFSTITSRSYRVFEKRGNYTVFLINGNDIVKKTYEWVEKNKTKKVKGEENENGGRMVKEKITGMTTLKNRGVLEGIFSWISSFFKKIFSLL